MCQPRGQASQGSGQPGAGRPGQPGVRPARSQAARRSGHPGDGSPRNKASQGSGQPEVKSVRGQVRRSIAQQPGVMPARGPARQESLESGQPGVKQAGAMPAMSQASQASGQPGARTERSPSQASRIRSFWATNNKLVCDTRRRPPMMLNQLGCPRNHNNDNSSNQGIKFQIVAMNSYFGNALSAVRCLMNTSVIVADSHCQSDLPYPGKNCACVASVVHLFLSRSTMRGSLGLLAALVSS